MLLRVHENMSAKTTYSHTTLRALKEGERGEEVVGADCHATLVTSLLVMGGKEIT